MRIRANGEVLVACASRVYRLDALGVPIQTYTTGSVGETSFFFAMNLDPDTTSFWTGGYDTGNIYKIDIKTGAVRTSFRAPPAVFSMAGLAIFGEPSKKTLPDKAVELAKTLTSAPYLLGAKGWDYKDLKTWVESARIRDGYHYCKVHPKTFECDITFGKGLDCSGLVMWSYNKAFGATEYLTQKNPVFYEGADGQFNNNSQPINVDKLKPGDLLFFNYGGAAVGHADHVAVYVGNGQTIEAYNTTHGIISRPCDPTKGCERSTTDPSGVTLTTDPPVLGKTFNFLGFGRVVANPLIDFQARAFSPISLIVTDPDGFTITAETLIVTEREQLREVPGNLYYSEWDINGDGDLDTIVVAPILKEGDYIIKVVPKPNALPSDTYTLEIEVVDTITVLAQDISIRDIPSEGYGIRSTGGVISQFIPVAIDIKPGSFPNSINPKSSGTIPVATLSTSDFDASSRLDTTSLTFGPTGDEKSLAFCNAGGEDVNGDGLRDLVCHFNTRTAAFRFGDTQGILNGTAVDGTPITGKDSIRIVP